MKYGVGGNDELSFRFIVLLLHGLSCAFIVMSGDDELSLRFVVLLLRGLSCAL